MREMLVTENSEEILKNNRKVVIYFTAVWCGPCKILKPIMKRISEKEDFKNVYFLMLDTDTHNETAKKMNITSVPTVLIYLDGELKETIVGVRAEVAITKTLKEIYGE